MRTTNRKLKKLIEEEEKTIARIEELQEYLKEIREARKKEEDLAIIRSIRSMKLGARELLDLLGAIQEGNLSEELREQLLAGPESDEEAEPEEASGNSTIETAGTMNEPDGDPDNDEGVKETPESEENNDAERNS